MYAPATQTTTWGYPRDCLGDCVLDGPSDRCLPFAGSSGFRSNRSFLGEAQSSAVVQRLPSPHAGTSRRACAKCWASFLRRLHVTRFSRAAA
jgi:hypothetical protein